MITLIGYNAICFTIMSAILYAFEYIAAASNATGTAAIISVGTTVSSAAIGLRKLHR